jgi:hypothetical protein
VEISGSPVFTDGDYGTDQRIHDNTWTYVVYSETSNVMKVQVNNQTFLINPSVTPASANTGASWYIGGRQYPGFLQPYGGYLDEVRISNAVRGDSWRTAEYNNQKPSSTFLTFGALTPVGTTGKRFFLIPN